MEILLISIFIQIIHLNFIHALHEGDSLLNSNIIVDDDPDIVYHAFVQTGSELHYFKDISYSDSINLPISTNHMSDIRIDKNNAEQKNTIRFDEDITNFGQTIIGVPLKREIHIKNFGSLNIIIGAIISLGGNFHCSFFETHYLLPNNRTSFYVYFLPMTDKPAIKEDVIILHTSIGQFFHKVRGEVTGNPYRIRSILGVRIPINATFSAPIRVHNPHHTQIQLQEVLSSDCNIHLEELMDIGGKSLNFTNMIFHPFQTREIGLVRISGNIERNTTAFLFFKFIRKNDQSITKMKLRKNANIEMLTLFLPLHIEITRRRGIFSTTDLLDFGFVKIGEKLSPMKLSIFSTLERGIEIETVYTDKLHGVYLQFESQPPISIKSGTKGHPGPAVPIANINIDTNLIENEKYEGSNNQIVLRTGLVITESRGGNYNLTVPFKSILYKGSIIHNPEDICFHSSIMAIKRDIMLTNTFPFGLAIYSVDIAENAKNFLQAYLITLPFILPAGQSSLTLTLNYSKPETSNFSSSITLYTNISIFRIPVYVFDGHLQINLHSLKQDCFEFGAVKRGESRSIMFTLSNSNPVPLLIKRFYLPFPGLLTLKLITIRKRDLGKRVIPSYKLDENHFEDQIINFVLPADSIAYFELRLFIHSAIRIQSKNIFSIKTQFSTYEFPVKFYLTNFTMVTSVPKKIIYHDVFIGAIGYQPLMLVNFYSEVLRVSQISISNGDPRFQLSISKDISTQHILIRPGILSNIANISFLPHLICPEDCYLGMELSSSDGQWFAYAMKWPENLVAIDHYLYSRMRQKWINLKEKVVKSSVNVYIDKIGALEIPIEGYLRWPRLFVNSTVHFPLTAVGNFSILNLTITNPTLYPVIVQIFPFVIYHDPNALLELFKDDLRGKLINPIKKNETLMFTPLDTEFFPLKHGSPIPNLREEIEKILEGPVPRFTLSMLIRPGMSTQIRVGFLPSDYTLRSSMLIIRNNLTILEPIILYGRGAKMNMEINNKTAKTTPLLFELAEQHLSECANPQRQLRKMPTNLTVKRSFTIRNSGEVGFNVVNISINGIPCENRGYRVLNCDRFRLEPNETTYLDIAFTPDFLFYVNDATLQIYIHMNNTPWSFDLSTTIPRHLLSICHSALPRPPFEALMYQTCVLALIFCLICVISCAYLEGDRIVQFAYKQQFLQEHDVFANGHIEFNVSFGITDIIKDSGINSKREFLQISPQTKGIIRWFWQTLNFILFIFSYIWPLIRSDQMRVSLKKPAQKQILNFHPLYRSLKSEIEQSTHNINKVIQKRNIGDNVDLTGNSLEVQDVKSKLTDNEQIDGDNESLNGGVVSRASHDYSSEDSIESHVGILLGSDEGNAYEKQNNVGLFLYKNDIQQKNLLNNPTTGSDVLKNNPISDYISQRDKILKQEIHDDSITYNNVEKKLAKEFDNCNKRKKQTPGPIQAPSRNESNKPEKTNSENLPFMYTFAKSSLSTNSENRKNSRKISDGSEKNNEFSKSIGIIKHVYCKSTNSSDSINFDGSETFGKYMADDSSHIDMDLASEESDIPEWLDQNIISSNVDDELNTLASQSAALFENISKDNLMVEQSNIQNDTLEGDECFKPYPERIKNQDIEIELIIEQLTREYHDKLTAILKGRKLTCQIPMPSDLSANFENIQNDNTCNNFHGKEFQIVTTTPDSPEQSNDEISVLRSGFLFNICDPIWKPISKFDEETAGWPDMRNELEMKEK